MGRLIAEIGGLEGLQKEAHRTFVKNLAHRVTQALDRMAGPRSLSAAEREIQNLCRDRFALYDPTCASQVKFVHELSSWATAAKDTPSGPEGPGQDELMAALLHDNRFEKRASRGPSRRIRTPEFSRRRPQHGRRREWDHYLGNWR